jgi:hypothetical protein
MILLKPFFKKIVTVHGITTPISTYFTATYRTASVYRVLQMRGKRYADVLPVLQVPDNKADAVPCEHLQKIKEAYSSSFQPTI